jgi:hypothetical protein
LYLRPFISIALFLVVSAAAAGDAVVWHSLGTTSVTATPLHSKPQQAEIRLMSARGPFASIRLNAYDGTVMLDHVVITFAHGSTQRVGLRKKIESGAFTPVIRLTGDDRVIRTVAFGYTAPKFANVRLYAR